MLIPFRVYFLGDYSFTLLCVAIFYGIFAYYHIYHINSKYSKIKSREQITGRDVAEHIVQQAGIRHVQILSVDGELSDRYDPAKRQLLLTQDTYCSSNLAAIGKAAHEAGHVIQHRTGSILLKFRQYLIICSNYAYLLLPFIFIVGVFLNLFGLRGARALISLAVL